MKSVKRRIEIELDEHEDEVLGFLIQKLLSSCTQEIPKLMAIYEQSRDHLLECEEEDCDVTPELVGEMKDSLIKMRTSINLLERIGGLKRE